MTYVKQTHSWTVVGLLAVFLSLTLILSGCSGQAKHPPRKGEYGKVKVTSVHIPSETIEFLNSEKMPKNYFKQEFKDKINMNFEASSKGNPYRFVIVVRGKAKKSGEVDVVFFSEVGSETSDQGQSEVLVEEDTHTYKANEKVLLVLPSAPFSVSAQSQEADLIALAGLTKRENIELEQVELQIWQGKGSKYPMLYYLGFFAVVSIPLLVVYRFVWGGLSRS